MSLSHTTSGNTLIVNLSGRMDVHQISEIENELYGLIADNELNLLLNLNDVEYMSSSSLRVFVALMRMLMESNRTLKLCCLSVAVRKVFEVVELMDMFDIFESQEEALAS